MPGRLEAGGEQGIFAPAADILETDNHYLLSFDIPGVSRDDLQIEMEGHELRVSGERKREHKEEGEGRYSMEREYGRFERSFALPTRVNTDRVEANYQDGVLRIALTKLEGTKRQKIQIGEARPGWWTRLLESGEERKEKNVKVA